MMLISAENLLIFPGNHYGIILASVLAIGVAYFLSRGTTRRKSGIPGNLGIPFLGETISFLSATNSSKGCYDFVRLRRLWYGKWFKTRIFGKIHVFVPSVEGAKTIFANDFTLFNKGYFKPLADAVGKKSVLCTTEENHKRIRRLLSDPFSMNSLSKFVQKFDKMLTERLKKLEKVGKSFVLLNFNMKMTFDAMCDMLMSVTDASLLEQMDRDCSAVSAAMLSFPVMIPGTAYYKGIKARNRLMETFKEMIARRRNGEENPDDFLQTMLQRDSYPANEKFDDEEIMDNLLTLIIGGRSTTAAAIMWSVKFLNDHREAQDRLREEQLSILRNKPEGSLLTLEDFNNMSYASKVVKETLRMANISLWLPRVALDNCTIDGKLNLTFEGKKDYVDTLQVTGTEIKKGWHVNVDAAYIHYDPDTYKDPLLFNPSRFDEMQKPYSYIPFGSGPRTCLGMNMAKVTMLAFLHRLTSEYKWTVDDLDPSLEGKVPIPRLRSGCPITLTAL